MINNFSNILLNCYKNKSVKVKFSELDLSGDSGLFLVKQAEEKIKICQGMANCLEDSRQEGKVTHSKIRLIHSKIPQIHTKIQQIHSKIRP